MDEELVARAEAFQQRMVDAGQGFAGRSTIPVFGFQNGIVQDRTGVLFEIAGCRFIVTAAHGLQRIVENRIFLGVPDIVDGPPIKLEECRIALLDEQTHDIAAIRLTKAIGERIAMRSTFLRTCDLDPGKPPPNGFYLIYGFPRQMGGYHHKTVACSPKSDPRVMRV